MQTYAFRLHRGQDLREEIDAFVRSKNIKAGVVLTCVGNLSNVVLRMAGGKDVKTWQGTFEIVSLVGTLEAGNGHLHLSMADNEGNVFGGHLKAGTIVGTTAEVVLGMLDTMVFSRQSDPETGYDELVVSAS